MIGTHCAIHGRLLDTAGHCDFCGNFGGRDYVYQTWIRYSDSSSPSKEEICEELRVLKRRIEDLETQLRGQP